MLAAGLSPAQSRVETPSPGITTASPPLLHNRLVDPPLPPFPSMCLRSRYPNAGPSQGAELCTDCWTNGVVRWHHNTSCVGKAATVYRDLRDCDNDMKLPSGLYVVDLPQTPPPSTE